MDANTTIIISLIALVLAIFGALWLNQRSTERLIEQMEKRFDVKFETLSSKIESLEKWLDNRLDNIERRLDRVELQLESIFKPVLPK